MNNEGFEKSKSKVENLFDDVVAKEKTYREAEAIYNNAIGKINSYEKQNTFARVRYQIRRERLCVFGA